MGVPVSSRSLRSLCALVIAWVAAVAFAVPPPAPAPAPAAVTHEPFELFRPLVPVFKHDRCANCHGVINPLIEGPGPTGLEHEPGMIGTPDMIRPQRMLMCTEGCHDSPKTERVWATPPSNLSFHDKNDMQLCRMQAAAVREDGADHYYDHHLLEDPLIADAFEGTMGGMRSSSMPAPTPPLKQRQFNDTAKVWLDAGAACGTWTGEIKQVEEFESDYSYGPANSTTTVHERATRTFTVNRRNGEATASIDVNGSQTMVIETILDGCSMTITTVSNWEGNTPPNAPAKARFEFDGFNTYSIHVRGPRESVTRRSTSSVATNCPIGLSADPPAEPETHSYEPYRYSIRCSHNTVPGGGTCSLEVDPDEDEPPRMDGRYQRRIINHLDAASPQSWLSTSLAGISRSDNLDPLPVQVTTTWNLKVVE